MSKKKTIMTLLLTIVLASFFALYSMPKQAMREQLQREDKIAVLYLDGMIGGSRQPENFLSGRSTAEELIRQLHLAADDSSVKAIVLRINSPGGSTTATEEVAGEIRKVRARGKRVVASMGDIAASGGYWLAACTDKIYANPTTLTGSIGVYMPYSNWEELYKKIGIRQEKIKSGEHKDILSADRPMTAEERAILQTMVNEIYESFVMVVAEERGMEPAAVRQLADGRIYTGRQAKTVGLVDALGNLYDAIDDTAALAGIEGKPRIKEYGKNNPLTTLLTSDSKAQLLQTLLGAPAAGELDTAVPMAVPEKW